MRKIGLDEWLEIIKPKYVRIAEWHKKKNYVLISKNDKKQKICSK